MRKNRNISIVFFILLVSILFVFINTIYARSPLVNILISPKYSNLSSNLAKTVELTIRPENASHKISGFTLDFQTEDNLVIDEIKEPLIFPTTSSPFTGIIKETYKISYVNVAPENLLPSEVKIPISLKLLSSKSSFMKINTKNSQIVGNIPQSKYEFDKVEEARFNTPGWQIWLIRMVDWIRNIFKYGHLLDR